MQKDTLYDNIISSYNNKNYIHTLNDIEKYINTYKIITDHILDIYYHTLYKLNKYDESLILLHIMKDKYPNYFSKYYLIKQYIKLDNEENAYEIYNTYKNKLTPEEKYSLSNFSFLCEKHKLSKHILTEYQKHANDNEEIYLKKKQDNLEQQLQEPSSHEVLYDKFVMNGNTLNKGNVIYAHVKNYLNINNNDPKKSLRPYLVWKKEDNKVYALKLTTQIRTKNEKSILYKDKYPFLNKDTEVRDTIVEINEDDIKSVNGRINKQDYYNVLEKVYTLYSFKYGEHSKLDAKFIESYNTNILTIEPYNIIKIHEKESKIDKYYFILETNIQGRIKCIELDLKDSMYSIKNNQIVEIKLTKPFLKLYDPNPYLKDYLKQEALKRTNYNRELLGTRVKTKDNKILDILKQENDYYICIDKTINLSSLLEIKVISINEELTILDVLDDYTYQGELFELKKHLQKNRLLIKSIKKTCNKK